jgi:hypothetical protein
MGTAAFVVILLTRSVSISVVAGNILLKYRYNYLDTEFFVALMLKVKNISYEYIFAIVF